MMLSECLIAIAVTSPPKVCITTVPTAQKPKLLHLRVTPATQPTSAYSCPPNRMGAQAGIIENAESWTFRIQRSGGVLVPDDDLRIYSK